ncbi:MAG: ankyrin repeat domain-containing protein [Longimicrobiales bacterium]
MSFGATPLLEAVGRGDRAAIVALLDAGADINERSDWWAGSFGVLDSSPPELAPFLIEHGAVLDAHAAARLGMIDELRELVEGNPACVHARGGDGKLPLHFAPTTEIADLLLACGADIDAEDIDHESTPAQHLVHDHNAVAYHLVRSGCRTDILLVSALGDAPRVRAHLQAAPGNIRMRVNDTWFPMRNPRAGGKIYRWTIGWNRCAHTAARENGHVELYGEIMEVSPPDLALCIACEVGDGARVTAILREHPSIASQLAEPELLQLSAMAELGNRGAALRMLEAGFPADTRGQHGQTALHWAAFHGDAELAGALIDHGVSVDAVESQFGGTPGAWARHGRENSWFRERGDYGNTLRVLSGP